jgi:hypothetical protein
MMRSTPRATHIQHTTGLGFELQGSRLARSIDRSRGRGASSHRRNVVSYAAVRCMGVCARRATAHSGLRTHARTHGHKPRPRRGLSRADLTGLCAQQPVRCAVALRHSTGTVARGEEPLGTAVAPHCDCDFEFRCEYLDFDGLVRCSLTSPTSASSGRATRDSARSSIACAAQPYTERPQRAPLDGGWKTSADGIC